MECEMKEINTLYYGDNLEVLQNFPAECVDLIYLDPPFNSKANYNVLFGEGGSQSKSQIRAFDDTWHWGMEAEKSYATVMEKNGKPADALEAFRGLLGDNDMMAYLAMMTPRLIELRRVLKDTGSIYLHCDPTASHYLKILMDSIFGKRQFRNEIAWCYRGAGYPKKDFGKRHDVILRYSKTENYYFNLDDVREEYAETTKERFKHYIGNVRGGNDFGQQSLNPKGKHPDDWWQIQPIAPSSNDRLGYPTQKPLSLLEKIVLASSNKGDVILDPFCGCGTTIHAAQKLERNWLGIDITHLAIGLIEYRLQKAFSISPKVIGAPEDMDGAVDLAKRDKYQFEAWAVTRIPGIMPNQKKGADGGIDGRGRFFQGTDKGKPNYGKIIVSVKGGKNIGVSMIRDLKGTMDREKAELGIFLCLALPTRPMMQEAASAGLYKDISGRECPKVQILTMQEWFDGKKPVLPLTIEEYRQSAARETGEHHDFL